MTHDIILHDRDVILSHPSSYIVSPKKIKVNINNNLAILPSHDTHSYFTLLTICYNFIYSELIIIYMYLSEFI